MLENPIREAGWTVHFSLGETAGLEAHLVDFHGRRVLWQASLPYVTIDHQRQDMAPEDQDVEAHGPWWCPLGQRTLVGQVWRSHFRGGFEVAADFARGPWRFTQMWRFHEDGRLAPWLTIHGPGLHPWHTYHPHWRFDFDLDGAADDALEHFADGHWTRVAEEGWIPYTGEASPEGHVWRQVDFGSGAAVGIRPHLWEDAEVFAIRYHAGEWPAVTPRAGAGAAPFPAAYLGAEPLDGQDVMLWYVAHVHYDQGFPFTAGPWLKVEGL